MICLDDFFVFNIIIHAIIKLIINLLISKYIYICYVNGLNGRTFLIYHRALNRLSRTGDSPWRRDSKLGHVCLWSLDGEQVETFVFMEIGRAHV